MRRTTHLPIIKFFLISLLITSLIPVLPALASPLFAVAIAPTKTDAFIGGDGDGLADAGETIEYTVTIPNSGTTDATGVTFTDIIDINTTLVGGSLAVSPIAVDESYTATGNVSISITAGSGLLANDYLGLNPAATITTYDATSTQGGNVVVNADGSFTYNPAPGYEGTDTFTYTLSNSTGSNNATVTITISGMVWFINNNAAACTTLAAGCGRLSNPFSTLASFNAINNGTGNNPSANDNIFVYESATGYTGGVTLLSGQKLIGQDSTSTLSTITGLTPPSGSASFPAMNTGAPAVTIQNAGGIGVTLNSGNTLNGFTGGNSSSSAISGSSFGTLTVADVIVNTTGQALSLTNGTLSATFSSVTSTGGTNNISLATGAGTLTGTLTISAGALSGATGNSFDINGGTAAISNAATIASGFARSVNVTGKTGGTVIFSGAITDTDTGISLTTNTGATINFIGGLSLSTGANTAFNATGGGTVNVCDENPCNPAATGALVNTLTSTTGTALNVANTTIGSNNLEFRSISANGALKGIILNTTGSSGGLSVTGSGTTNGSGGTIQNISTRGAEFINTRNLSLKNITFTSACTTDFPAAPTGLSLGVNTADNAVIHLQNVTNAALDNVDITGSAEQGINGHNVSNFSYNDSTMLNVGNGPDEDGIHFYNMVGTSTINNTTITSSGDDNINIQNNNNLPADLPQSTVGTITINGGSANTGVLGSGYLFGIRGTMNTTVVISGITANNNFSGGIVIDTYDTATSDLEITGVTSTNNNDAISISSNNGNTNFDIHDNVSFAGTDFGRINVLKAAFSTGGTLEGRIHNNPIVVTNGQTTDGVSVQNLGAGTLKVLITNNIFDYQGTQRALYIAAGQDGNATLEATVTDNTFDIKLDGTGDAITAIFAQAAVASPSGDPSSMCIDIGGAGVENTFSHSLGGTMAAGDIRVRQRFISNVRMPGYGGGGTDTAAAAAYLNARNTTIASPSTVTIATSISGGAACAQPNYAMSPNSPQVVALVQPENKVFKQAAEINSTSASVGAGGKPLFLIVQPVPMQSGETVSVTIGTLPAGESVIIKFRVTVDNPLPLGTTQLSNQGTISGSNFADVLTDDPSAGGTSDPTITLVDRPDTTVTSINRVGSSPTNATSVSWTVTFAAAVDGLSSSNFTLTSTGTASGSIASVTASSGPPSTTWNVTVNSVTGDGTLRLDMSNDTGLSHDVTNQPFTTGQVYIVDHTVPSVAMSSATGNPTNASPIPVTVQFSETVTGFTLVDITAGNGTVGNFVVVDGDTYTFDLTPSGQGLVTADIAGAVAQDTAGNDNTAATQFSRTYDSVPPTVAMSSAASDPTNISPISVTVQFSETVTGFVVGDITPGNGTLGNFVAVDGDTYTFDLTPSGQGLVTADIAAAVAVDGIGNGNLAATQLSRTYDSIAPTTSITANPTNPTASANASFTFSGTDTGGSGVASLECDLDGGGFTTCTSSQSYTGLSDGSHTFQVRAVDNAGNVDASPASYIWMIDTTAPNTTITGNPTNPTNSTSAAFAFTGNDGSGTGVASFQCDLDGGGFSTCTTPQNYTGLSDGSHTFQVRAIDGIGNTDPTPATFTWVVDANAPDTTIDSNPADPDSDSTPTFTFSGTDAGSGVAGFECSIDAGAFAACTSPNTLGTLADGSHTFQVRAVDNLGNTDATPASYTWTIDTTLPDTTLDSTPPDPDSNDTPSFAFSSTDGTATFECQMDGGGYSACISGDSFGPLGDGSHTFDVRAVDPVGNRDATPASFTWIVDTGAPDTTIDSNPALVSNTTNATFNFSSPDLDVSGFECRLDGAAFASCTSPQNYVGLSAGSHTFEVRSLDNAANVDPSPASFTWTIDLGFPTVLYNANTVPASGASLTTGPTQITVAFSEDVKNDGTAGAANNITNFLLVEDGADNIFDTLSCVGTLVADDTQIAINTATYTNNGGGGPFVATLSINGGTPLPNGTYRLYICGTTSIEDLAGNELNNGASDAILNFTVVPASVVTLPLTGFTPLQITELPQQPLELSYKDLGSLWIEIPSLKIKEGIVGVPKFNNSWDTTWLGKQVGWLNSTAYPTWEGNSVLTGHVTNANGLPGPFAKIKDLKYGDQIIIHLYDEQYIFEVRTTRLVRADTTTFALQHLEDNSFLTLITCQSYDPQSDSYRFRRIVRAVLIEVK